MMQRIRIHSMHLRQQGEEAGACKKERLVQQLSKLIVEDWLWKVISS